MFGFFSKMTDNEIYDTVCSVDHKKFQKVIEHFSVYPEKLNQPLRITIQDDKGQKQTDESKSLLHWIAYHGNVHLLEAMLADKRIEDKIDFNVLTNNINLDTPAHICAYQIIKPKSSPNFKKIFQLILESKNASSAIAASNAQQITPFSILLDKLSIEELKNLYGNHFQFALEKNLQHFSNPLFGDLATIDRLLKIHIFDIKLIINILNTIIHTNLETGSSNLQASKFEALFSSYLALFHVFHEGSRQRVTFPALKQALNCLKATGQEPANINKIEAILKKYTDQTNLLISFDENANHLENFLNDPEFKAIRLMGVDPEKKLKEQKKKPTKEVSKAQEDEALFFILTSERLADKTFEKNKGEVEKIEQLLDKSNKWNANLTVNGENLPLLAHLIKTKTHNALCIELIKRNPDKFDLNKRDPQGHVLAYFLMDPNHSHPQGALELLKLLTSNPNQTTKTSSLRRWTFLQLGNEDVIKDKPNAPITPLSAALLEFKPDNDYMSKCANILLDWAIDNKNDCSINSKQQCANHPKFKGCTPLIAAIYQGLNRFDIEHFLKIVPIEKLIAMKVDNDCPIQILRGKNAIEIAKDLKNDALADVLQKHYDTYVSSFQLKK